MAIKEVFKNPDELAFAAAQFFCNTMRESVARQGYFVCALSGGTTPKKMYEILAAGASSDGVADLPWDKTHIFWSDERCVAPDDPLSNYKMANETLLSRVPIPPSNVHRVKGELDKDQVADDYEQEIIRFFALHGITPVFDLVILGMGSDGHIASLFPNTSALVEVNRLVAPNFVPDVVPHERVTFTLPLINSAKNVLLLVSGTAKYDALLRSTVGQTVASRVNAEQTYWYLDRAAQEGSSLQMLKHGVF